MNNALVSNPAAPAILQDILDAVRRGLTSTSASVKCTHNADRVLWAEVKSVRPNTLSVQMRAVGDVVDFFVSDARDRAELIELLDAVFHGRVTLKIKNIFGVGASRVMSVNVGEPGESTVKYRPSHSLWFILGPGRVSQKSYEPYSYALSGRVIRS